MPENGESKYRAKAKGKIFHGQRDSGIWNVNVYNTNGQRFEKWVVESTYTKVL